MIGNQWPHLTTHSFALTHVLAHHVRGYFHNALVQKVQKRIARHARAEEHQCEVGNGNNTPDGGKAGKGEVSQSGPQLGMQIGFLIRTS